MQSNLGASRHRHACSFARAAVIITPGLLVCGPALAQAPEYIELTGVVRDFKERSANGGHPDFERRPTNGFGLYVGYVAHFLGANGKPIYSGAGYKVNSQWRDAQGRTIAAHLFNARFEGGGQIRPATGTVLEDSDGRDAYEITVVDAKFNYDGTSKWSYRVRELAGGRDLQHWTLKLDPAHLVDDDGTTDGYEIGIDQSTGFYGIKWDVDPSFSNGVFTVILEGHYVGVNDAVGVLAEGGASDTGPLFVPSPEASNLPTPFDQPLRLVGGQPYGDTPGSRGSNDGGAITSMESFSQWYENVPNVNLSKPLTLRFVRQPDGSYVFDNDEDPAYQALGGFFPIEGELWGNPGGNPDRNFHFTYELHTTFTYDEDDSQFFHFGGDDDVWVFIDGKLAIDLGGVHAETEQFADLRRFGLVDGETYRLDFFFAERHRTQSNFRIKTNLLLRNAGPAGNISALYD